MRKILFVLISLTLIVPVSFAQPVVHYGQPEQSLQQRFDGAIKEIRKQKSKGAWFAYSIARLMGEQEFIGNFDISGKHNDMSLRELITGQKPQIPFPDLDSDKHVREEAKRALDNMEKKPEKKVWKDVAILCKYNASGQLTEIDMSVLDVSFRLENMPLIWIGKATQEESIPLLRKLYTQVAGGKKEDVIAAIGIHTNMNLVLPALSGIIDSNEPEDLRKSAVFWLGQTQQPAALSRLQHIVKNDRSEEVRKGAVFAISQMELPAADQTLFDLAKNSRDQEIRLDAIFWIGQQNRPNAAGVLEKIALEDPDREAQKKAIFSLSQMNGDEVTNKLIKIAETHPHMEARKEAIFWLAQKSSGKTAKQLSNFANNSEETEIQKQAVFALSQFEGENGVRKINRLCRDRSETRPYDPV